MSVGLVLLGFLVGTLVGLTSMGGAALMTPILILVLKYRPLVAVGSDLAYSSLTKIVGAAMHWRQGTVSLKPALRLAYGSVPGSLLGVWFLGYLRRTGYSPDESVRHALGAVLILAAALLLARSLGIPMPSAPADFLRRYSTPTTIAWGAVVGFAVGVTSVGSGSLIAPFLMTLMPGDAALVVGTDVFHSALLVSTAALGHIGEGNVDWNLVTGLLMGSIPGVMLGTYMAKRMPPRALRVGMSAVLLVTGFKLM